MSRLAALPLLLAAICVGAPAQAGPQIQRWETANGARVLFVPSHELPMLDVQVVFDAGGARDGDAPGLASLTSGLLFEGTGERSVDDIAHGFESLGAQYGAESMRDMAAVSLRTLADRETREPAVALFAEVLAQASFPEDAITRDRDNTLLALQLERQQPASVAARAFQAALYGDHPYAAMPIGTRDSVEAITADQIRAFKARYYVAANALIALVGDLSRAEAQAVSEHIAGGLDRGERAPGLAPVEPLAGPVQQSLDHPSQQTHILLGQPGLRRDDPDYFPLYVGNHILGGSGLVSRISQTIREQRGLAYSAYSYFAPMRESGPWTAGLQTRNDQAQEAIGLLRAVIGEFIAAGPTREELARAKSNITGGFPLRLDSNRKILEHLAMIGFYDLPDDYLDTFTSKVEKVTAREVREAFQQRLTPDRMVLVTVGGPSG